MAVDIAIDLASKAVDLVIVPVGRQIGYAWNCEDYIDELKTELKEFKEIKGRLQRRVKEAKRRGDKIEPDVDEWLKNAKDFIRRADEFIRGQDGAKKTCFVGLGPDCKTRYQLGRKAKKVMLQEVVDLRKRKDEFDAVSYREAPQGIGPVKGYEAFDSRMSTFKEIMLELADPNVNKIGVYGINGVGKTTLVREIARQAEEEKLFDEVVMATVFRDQTMKEMQGETTNVKCAPDLRRIQGEIADGLDFQFHMEMERGRADELRERLKDESRKLVILDNIWEGLELEDLGIPSDHEGCKILMTSSNQKVLSSQMGSKNNHLLNTLPPNEARNWFKQMVGDDVFKDPSLEEVSIQVADRCAGLPILLLTVARGLKDNSELKAWKDALRQLSSFDKEEMHAHVDLALQLNYDLLANDEIKKLFLLCGQLPPYNIFIMDLLKYSFGLGLFKQVRTVEEARTRLLRLLTDLKASCLLLEGSGPGRVKMHDVVHSFAISVASKDHNVFTAAYDTDMTEWPAEDVLEQLTAVYFPYCKIHELPDVLECPKLESFLLLCKEISVKIPDNFFKKTRNLRVLDLTKIHLSSLPASFKYLDDLRTLCLDRCILEDMTLIGKLKKLQILSLSGSDIIRLPKEIGQLTRLRLLDLSRCRRLEVIPPNVLSCLTQLEDLYMENSFLQWEIEGVSSKKRNASLAELKLLSNLNTLDIHITDPKMLPKGLFSEKLERFRIFIGDGWNWSGKYITSRTLKIKLSTSIQLEKGLKVLLKRAEDLHLDELHGVQNSLYELDAQGFPQLKHLHVENSREIQYIIDSRGMGACAAFKKLESLSLENLKNLKKICEGQLMSESFSNLRVLKVGSCDALKNLFSSSMAKSLLRLEEINISDCKIIEEIVTEEYEDDADGDDAIKLPQLRKLTLDSLPQFTSFYSKVKATSALQTRQLETDVRSREIESENEPEASMPLFNKRVVFPNLKELSLSSINIEKIWHDHILEISSCIQNLTTLNVDGCNNLKYLLSSSIVESLVNLKTLKISNCRMMEQIIVTDGFREEGTSKMLLRQLDFLQLKDLPELTQFCCSSLLKCPALKGLLIQNCPKLRTFISNPATANLVVGSEDEILNSSLFNEKVAFPKLEALGIFNMNMVKMIWNNELHEDSFSKLKRLDIGNALELVKVFPSNYVLSKFQNLEILSIADCNSLEEVFGLEAAKNDVMVPSKLKTLRVRCMPNLKHIWNKDVQGILSFRNLRVMNVFQCPNLKSVFPTSIARGLSQLTLLNVTFSGVEEIVSKEEGDDVKVEFEFPELTYLRLWKLSELKRFYPGRHTSDLPKLKFLNVYDCDKIKIFTSESQSSQEAAGLEDQLESPLQQPLFSAEKVIPNLEELPLNADDATMILNGQFSEEFFSNVKFLHLQCFHDESTVFPVDVVQRFNKLEKLIVANSCFKELFVYEGVAGEENQETALVQVRNLRLGLLYNLIQIKLDHMFKKVETLEVWECDKLINLAPSSGSFQNLKSLEVKNCKGLLNLITSSTADSLMQLTKVSIVECNMLTEIVANEGEEGKDEITFSKLESLRLDCLTSLTSFSSANCAFKFPSLEEVIVKQCPKMKIFSEGDLHAPKLRGVQTEGRDRKRWLGDLNTTLQQLYTELVGFNGLRQLKLSEFPELKRRWPEQLPVRFFYNLSSLIVDECEFCSTAVPSNLLPFLNVLVELEVKNCDLVEEVFEIRQPSVNGSIRHLSKLNKFQLVDLPKLNHVWNKNSKGYLDFRNLKLLKVHNCGSLRYVFTPSVMIGLAQLQELEVKKCTSIEEIVTKGVAQEAIIYKIRFQQLNSVTLECLPKLTSFYSGSGTVECPSLKKIAVVDCPATFTSKFLRGGEPSTSNEDIEPKVAFPSLENLRVEWNEIMDEFWHGKFQPNFFGKLKVFELIRCPHDYAAFPSRFLRRIPSLENLVLRDALFEEIVLHEETTDEEICIEVPTQLKELKLSKLHKLTILSKEDSKSCLVFQNLETLKVLECNSLKILVPASVPFKNLKTLKVSKCHGLRNLIFSSTAGSLKQLTSMSLAECELMEEIVANVGNGGENEIVFTQLKCLRLHCLPHLASFYSGTCAFVFPALEEVHVKECPKMKTFCQGDVKMPKLKKLLLSEGEDKGYWEGNLNAPIQQLFIEMGQAAAQSKPPGSPKQRNLESQTTHVEKGEIVTVSDKLESNNVHASKNPDVNKSLSAEDETTTKVVKEEEVMDIATKELDVTEPGSTYPHTNGSSNYKKDSAISQNTSTAMDNGTRVASQIPKDVEAAEKDETVQDKFMPASSVQQSSITSESHSRTAVERAIISTSAPPTKTTCTHELTDVTASKPVFHSPAHFLSLFASIEELLKPGPASSSQPTSNSISQSEFPVSSNGASIDTHNDHLTLLKKILKKPLSEVAGSADVHLMFSTLENLKDCPLLNSQQHDIVQLYLKNFDTLVTYQPFYEDQIRNASTLKFSVTDAMERIPELKTLYEELSNKATSLGSDKEALKKRLQEIEEEEDHVKTDMEGLYSELVMRKVKVKALPQATRQLKEAEDKTNDANDHWEKIRDLFA